MSQRICFVLIVLGALTANIGLKAQEASPKTDEERFQEALRNEFSNPEIFTPYQARLIYQEKLNDQKRLQDKQKALKTLADSFQYTPEELQKVSENYESNPPFENLLNPDEAEAMDALIQDDLAGAMARIATSGTLNPAYIPSDMEDSKPLLSEGSLNNQTQPTNTKASVAVQQTGTISSVFSVTRATEQSAQSAPKRLGRKAYNLNPNNFVYEENQ